jgi:hypothetical protein
MPLSLNVAIAEEPAVVGPAAAPGFGNAWLEQARMQRHTGWALGGMAELVHNSAELDVHATKISVSD